MVEPNLGGYNPPEPFGIGGTAAIHEIMRLLTGSVNIKNVETLKVLCLTEDQLRRGGPRTAKPARILSILFDEGVSLAEYGRFVVAASQRNFSFFQQLKRELTFCLICKKEGRYTESFLYLYRILEFVSLALPLLYASTLRNFGEGHAFLRSLLEDEKGSELKALEKAVPTLIAGTDLGRLLFDFDVVGVDLDFIDALRTEIRSKVAQKVKDVDFDRGEEVIFSVPFTSMSSFMVSLRNRMFHYKIGQQNIDLGAIGGAERVLRICLPEFIYWFALIMTEIIRTLARQSVRVA